MKIFANKSIFKKIVLIVLLLLSFSFVSPEPVQAGVGGELMEPICDFLVGFCDGIMAALHKYILKQDTTIIHINTEAFVGEGIVKFIATVLGAIIIAALIAVGVGAIGMAFTALASAIGAVGTGAAAVGSAFVGGFSWTALGTTIAANIGVIIPLALGGGIFGGAKIFSADGWRDKQIDLPLYSISPEEIFTNKIPLFDVNFFNPNPEKKYEYEWAMHLEITDEIKNASYRKLASGTMDKVNKVLKKYGTTAEGIKNSNYTDGTNGYYYYATGKNVLRLSAPTAGVAGIGNGEVTVYITDLEVKKGNTSIPSYGMALSKNIAKWYYTIRVIAIVGMMSVLVYVGIRILLSSTSSQKAKYKQMLGDWLVGMILLFTMHYIMIFSNMFIEKLTDLLDGINPTIYNALIQTDKGGKIEETLKKYGYTVTREKVNADPKTVYIGKDEKDGNEYLEWDTNLMGMLRIQVREIEQEDDSKYIGYSIMFLVMVFYTCIFCWTYIKRVVYLAFLTMIAPMVALTYPIDKANDGKAQGFDYWFKEYIFNLLLQPMHLIIYTVLLSTALELALTNWIYALVAIGFIATAEKIVRTMFNFSKANTPGVFAGPAGAALTMTGIRWLMGHGPRGGNSSGVKSGKEKNELSSDDKSAGYSTGSNKINMRNILGVTGNPPQSPDPNNLPQPPAPNNPPQPPEPNNLPQPPEPNNPIQPPTTNNNQPIIRPPRGGRLNALANTSRVYGRGLAKKMSRSLKDAKPIRSLGRLGAGAISGATLGMIGLSAGIASGDASKAFQYAGVGLAGGYKLGSGTFDSASNALNIEGLGDEYERSALGEEAFQRKKVEKNKKEYKTSEEHVDYLRKNNNWSRQEAEDFLNDEFVDKCLENNITNIEDINNLRKVRDEEHKRHTEKRPTGEVRPVMDKQTVEFVDDNGRKVTRVEEYDTGRTEPVYEEISVDDGAWNEDELIATFNTNQALFGGSTNTNKDTMNKMEVTLREREFKDTNDPNRFANETINRIEGLQKSLNRVKGNI